ncbi:MAG: nitrite/sulfite reductase [Deltaproteobacteria bacterium]|jgi:sulfite reductase (ferredoxin)
MTATWKQVLRIPHDLAEQIDQFETQIELRRREQIDEKIFAETRLRRGVYGQRYDNGLRHDGRTQRPLAYREHPTKGPNTVWDAPGMQRIKVPYGGLDGAQLERLAEVAEEYADGILHVTTRQDLQLHYVHIEDTPDIMRRLAEVGITTQEACGNVVRNVTGCHLAGVCKTESFDITPYARALSQFLLGHPDAQDFGRKFKISFSGCIDEACGVASVHDLGFIAKTREVDGRSERGFETWAGGGLGAVPHRAKLLFDFLPEAELLPMTQAVCRVFARLGEKKNRGKARLKFLVEKIGIDALRKLALEEREILPPDERWSAHLPVEGAAPPALVHIGGGAGTPWRERNVDTQRQAGLHVVTIPLPLGDLSSDQARALARIARRFARDEVRTSIEQNVVLRNVATKDLDAVESELRSAGLAAPYAGTIVDVTACPGTDTCKLGIASSRGLAGALSAHLAEHALVREEAVRDLSIKVSGCFNSCGQHHVADLGFYGVSRKKNGYTVPHFQVVVGGQWRENAGAFGLAIAAVPSKRIPEVVDRLTARYLEERGDGERFRDWVQRLGKPALRSLLADLVEVAPYEVEPALYTDWGDARLFSMKDHGVGECAGEVVSVAELGLQASEREVFEAQLELDADRYGAARDKAFRAMVTAARTLVRTEWLDVPDEPDEVVHAFRERFYDTKRCFDPFAGGKLASYLFEAHASPPSASADGARRAVQEAQLFIEAAYATYDRIEKEAS